MYVRKYFKSFASGSMLILFNVLYNSKLYVIGPELLQTLLKVNAARRLPCSSYPLLKGITKPL